jgi:excisionase family DNA binding protein
VSTSWLTVREAAQHARCGSKVIYRAVRAGKLKAAVVGGRRELRFLPEFVDEWLLATLKPVILDTNARAVEATRARRERSNTDERCSA